MYRTAIFVSATLLLCAVHGPARAMDICEALNATEETRTQISGYATEVGDETDPYLFMEDETGACEILVEVVDKTMLANCTEDAFVTAIGILRWDLEGAMMEDIDVNMLDEASVVCE